MNLHRYYRHKMVLVFLSIVLLMIACTPARRSVAQHTPMPVIFETDMGNDVDDALALDMLYKYQDEGLVNILAIGINKNSPHSPAYVDILNTWYGYPHIPIGMVEDGANSEGDSHNYAQTVAEYQPSFKRTTDTFPEAVALYRKVLNAQPDHSVVIISTGFSTNLARLLQSPGDAFSSLDGKSLIAQKVKMVSVMAGSFAPEKMIEYNVLRDVPAAKAVLENFPVKIVVSPFELGNAILYPAKSIQNDFAWTPAHPVVIAYKSYMPMPYDRQTWDLTSVLYAVEGLKPYFNISEPGNIQVDEKGYTSFIPDPKGNRQYLSATPAQAATIQQYFIDKITAPPKAQR